MRLVHFSRQVKGWIYRANNFTFVTLEVQPNLMEYFSYDRITADSFALILGGAGSGRAELDVSSLSVNMSGAGTVKINCTDNLRVNGGLNKCASIPSERRN